MSNGVFKLQGFNRMAKGYGLDSGSVQIDKTASENDIKTGLPKNGGNADIFWERREANRKSGGLS